MSTANRSQPRPPKPWPMKWVALAIFVCLVGYTIITLGFREGDGHQHYPYEEAQNRKITAERLETLGYTLTEAKTERPADPDAAAALFRFTRATVSPAPAGLPDELRNTLIVQPKLADTFSNVTAQQYQAPNEPYQIIFTCRLPDTRRFLADTSVYIKGDDIVIVTNFDQLDGDLTARTKETAVLLTLAPETLKGGHTYKITIAGREESCTWTVQVN